MKFLIFILLISFTIASAEAIAGNTIATKSTSNYLSFYTKLSHTSSEVEILDPNSGNELMYESNAKSVLNVGVHYSYLGLAYSFSLPSYSIDKYGKTTQNTFDIHFKKDRLMADLTFKNYNGYYLSNPDDFNSNWDDGNKQPQIPELKTKLYDFSATYVFNPDKYYANTAFAYKKDKFRSGGSWLLKGFVIRNSIFSDSSIVPLTIKQYVDPYFNLKNITTNDFGISLGYSYLWVIYRNFFASCTLLEGVSVQKISQQSSIDESIKKYYAVSPQTIFDFSVGLNAEKYDWGFTTHFESANSGSKVTLEIERLGIFFIYRVDTSNWEFMKGVDKVMHPRFLRFALGSPPEKD
jgi:hypothetical protein